MKIKSIKVVRQPFKLTRPYQIAYKTISSVENVIVEIHCDNGKIGLGAGSPLEEVTHETLNQSVQALNEGALEWLLNRDIKEVPLMRKECFTHFSKTPAACAAIDIALHDLYAQMLGQPLVDVFGRVIQALPTSITIGIKNTEETLKEAAEYFDRGFRVLKVKLGISLDEDIERLAKLREKYGKNIVIRVDPNQGYSLNSLTTFIDRTQTMDIEFIEQPLPTQNMEDLRALPNSDQKKIALDENIKMPSDAISALTPYPCCGIYNIKLMKCGGIYSAQQIAIIAKAAKIDLMWGCMDESIISITAALHTAFSCAATRYLDLDGSLDLADDIVEGGFELAEGMMRIKDVPGLGLIKTS